MKHEVRLRGINKASVPTRYDPARLHAVVPTVVFHLVAAGMNGAAAMGMGAAPTPVLTAGLAACALGCPVVGLALSLAGWTRTGAGMLVLTYVSSAALALYDLLGMGALQAALDSPAAPWKVAFFATAVLMPLLQIKGIIEAGRFMLEEG